MNQEKKRGRPKLEKKTNKFRLKIKRSHPTNCYPLGKHMITNIPMDYELDDYCQGLLGTTEYQHWVEEVKDEEVKE